MYHQSDSANLNESGAIKSDFGPFGSCLFFGSETGNCLNSGEFLYKLNAEDDQFIDASRFFYEVEPSELQEILEEVKNLTNCDQEQAEGLLDGSENLWDLASELGIEFENVGEIDWTIQALQAKAAKKLGYLGAAIEDENGSVLVADMLGKENLLIKQ